MASIPDLRKLLKKYKKIHHTNIRYLTKPQLDELVEITYRHHVKYCQQCQKGYHCDIGFDLFGPFRQINNL